MLNGSEYAVVKRRYRQLFGNTVTWQGTNYLVETKPLSKEDYPLLPEGVGDNALETDPTVFIFSPADLPGYGGTTIAAGKSARPLADQIITWQGLSYTVCGSPNPMQLSGVSHSVAATAYRTPQQDSATTEQTGEPTPGARVEYYPPDSTL